MDLIDVSQHYDLRGESALEVIKASDERDRHLKRHLNPLSRGLFEFIESRTPRPKHKGERLLDLCCGTGIYSVFPAQLGYAIDGVDISEKSVLAARERLACHGFGADSIKFVQGDALQFLEGVEEQYNIIQCVASLYYLKRTDIVDKIWHALKPGGLFIGIETNGDNLVANVIRRLRHRHLRHRDNTTLNELFVDSDFRFLSKRFEVFDRVPFDFLSLMGLVGCPMPLLERGLYSLGSYLDKPFFVVPGSWRMAFRIGYVGGKQI